MLVCVAMVGTGFASWVILDTQKKEATGNVTAEAVSKEGITLEVSPTSDANIIFGSPADMNIKNAWLIEDAAKGQGNLAVDFTVTVKGNIGSFTLDFSYTGDAFETAATNNLIVGYPTYTVGTVESGGSIANAGEIEIEQTNGKATLKFGEGSPKSAAFDFKQETTFHIIATFNWGSAFGGPEGNPYTFFNGKTQTETASDWGIAGGTVGTPTEGTGEGNAVTWADVAKDVLDWMNTSFSSVTYKVTFTAAQAAPSAG